MNSVLQNKTMRVIIQRVLEASVTIEGILKSKINQGLLILVGIEDVDIQEDINWLCAKIANLRIFSDEQGLMNFSVIDINGELLVISQFTLFANTKKGNRPSFIDAARPEIAVPLYKKMIERLTSELGNPIETGEFSADMKISLVNDGPVTIIIDSKNKI